MSRTGEIVRRVVIVMCVVIIFCTDYSGMIQRLLGVNKTEGTNLRPTPTNPGYGERKAQIFIEAEIEHDSIKNIGTPSSKSQILQTIKNACLPKLICELNATPEKEKLSDTEKSLLTLLRDTSITTKAELTSKYHFAAHMGQLIAGVESNGCHNFYPTCPFPGLQVLQMMKKNDLNPTRIKGSYEDCQICIL